MWKYHWVEAFEQVKSFNIFFPLRHILFPEVPFGDSQAFPDLQRALTRPLLMHESFPLARLADEQKITPSASELRAEAGI